MRAMSKSSNIIRLDNKHACPRTCFGYMFTLVMLPSSSVVPDIHREKKIRKKGMWENVEIIYVNGCSVSLFCLQSRVNRLKKKRNLNCGPYKLNIYPIG